MLTAPLGAGCYELRHGAKLVLFGMSGHVAARMTSLLPKPLGRGTRNNEAKRAYVESHLAEIEYRTIACTNRRQATERERLIAANRGSYLFPT
jgi:hypothetical protein